MNLQDANQGQIEQVPFGTVQHNLSDILPTASEIGYLWTSYLAECMSVCFLKNHVAKSKDPDIHTVLQRALDVSSQRVITLENIFNSFNHPVPEAYGDKDIDNNAKHLYSESFRIKYTRLMNKYLMTSYLNALSVSSRSDIRSYFNECMDTSKEIHQKATEILLAKGLLVKSPNIEIPDRVDFIHDKDYFGSILGIGGERPLNAIEINHIFSLMEAKQLFKTLKLGYIQVVKSEKIKNFILQGIEISDKQIKKLGSILDDEELPQPTMTSNLVSDSTESPFSDKLILCHVTFAIASVIAEDGYALTTMARKDLIAIFSKFFIEFLSLAKNGAELMIENGWLEKVPETTKRKDLIH